MALSGAVVQGGADQPGNSPHRKDPAGRAALALIAEQRQPGLQRRRQLQREQAEHGERQQYKHRRQADQDIWVLQGRLNCSPAAATTSPSAV